MRAGEPFTQLITFDDGEPDAGVSWTLRDGLGQAIVSGSVSPNSGDVSCVILVDASNNTLAGGSLFTTRDLQWNYLVGGQVRSGAVRYRVDGSIPFGVSPAGVRIKLGVDDRDLPDSEIDLIRAYLHFQADATTEFLEAALSAGDYEQIVVCDGIEALAALDLVPTMAVRVASKESSGTNQFQRQTVDWAAITAQLQQRVQDALVIVNPSLDPASVFGSIFVLTQPATDLFPGG